MPAGGAPSRPLWRDGFQPPQRRICALEFVAPEAGDYKLAGTAYARIWEGKNKMSLRLLRMNNSDAQEIGSIAIEQKATVSLDTLSAHLNAGDELVLLPEIDGMFNGGEITLRDFTITMAR